MINDRQFTAEARAADAQLLLRGYERAALTLNFIRSLIDGGFADLRHPQRWDLGFVIHSPQSAEYREMIRAVNESVAFLEAMAGRRIGELDRVEFFTSHEGLHLDYEQAQTRQVPRRTGWYNLSTHMPWIGDRTRQPDAAHVEYFAGIRNPIGIKCGPSLGSDDLLRLLDRLNPTDEAGRITLIARFGSDKVHDHLPRLVETVQKAGRTVVWCSDPMHGNTIKASTGYKTRPFDRVLSEVKSFFEIHRDMGTYAGGVHIEMTGDDVTECVGGVSAVTEASLSDRYNTYCDPRLNASQALELAFLVAEEIRAQRPARSPRLATL